MHSSQEVVALRNISRGQDGHVAYNLINQFRKEIFQCVQCVPLKYYVSVPLNTVTPTSSNVLALFLFCDKTKEQNRHQIRG